MPNYLLKMKIDRIELFHVSIPLEKPFHPAWIPGYPQTANRCTLARLTTNEGVQGIAAGVAMAEASSWKSMVDAMENLI